MIVALKNRTLSPVAKVFIKHAPVVDRLPRADRTSWRGARSHSTGPYCITAGTYAIIDHSVRRATVSNPASLNATQPVECAPRAWIILGLVGLVLEGAFAILSLAAVAFVTSVFLTRGAAISVRALLLPRLGRSKYTPGSPGATVFKEPTSRANCLTRDLQGRQSPARPRPGASPGRSSTAALL